MFEKGSPWKRLIEKLAEKSDVRYSEGFPWSKGIPRRNFPKPMTGGSGCMAPLMLLAAGLTLTLLFLIIF